MNRKFINILTISLFVFCIAFNSSVFANNNFNVRNVFYSFQSSELIIISQLDLSLSSQLIDAINNGVAISVAVEYAKPKKNIIGTRYDIFATATYEIERHSLSNRYLMRSIKTGKTDIFNSIQSALDSLGSSLKQSVQYKESIDELAVRCYVDKYRLPGPLRFKAFFSTSWSPSSRWSIWPLNS